MDGRNSQFGDEFIKLLQMLENSCEVAGLLTDEPDSFSMWVPMPVYQALADAIRGWKQTTDTDERNRQEKIKYEGEEAVERKEAQLPLFLVIHTEFTPGGVRIRPHLVCEEGATNESGKVPEVS